MNPREDQVMKRLFTFVFVVVVLSLLTAAARPADYMPPTAYVGPDQAVNPGESFILTAIASGTRPLTGVLIYGEQFTIDHPDTFVYTNPIYFNVTYTPGWTGTDNVYFQIIDTFDSVAMSFCYLTVLTGDVPVKKSTWGAIKGLYDMKTNK